MNASPDQLYHLPAARSVAQRDQMETLSAQGVCVFCPEHFEQYHREPVTWRGHHWYVTTNDYPYKGTTSHHLIVPYRHVQAFDELPDEAGAELWAIRRELKASSGPAATATVERSGDMRLNGGSVAHLHVHFVMIDALPQEPIRFRVSGAPVVD